MKKPDIKKVKCPIFTAENESIEKITEAINTAENIKEKSVLAKNLMREAEKLLNCEHFNEKRSECRICQYISKLRKKTAKLIIKAKELKS